MAWHHAEKGAYGAEHGQWGAAMAAMLLVPALLVWCGLVPAAFLTAEYAGQLPQHPTGMVGLSLALPMLFSSVAGVVGVTQVIRESPLALPLALLAWMGLLTEMGLVFVHAAIFLVQVDLGSVIGL